MAAQLRTKKGKSKPTLLNRLELNGDIIFAAVFIPHEDSIITLGADKSIRVWVMRDNGKYWPSVFHHMPDVGHSLDFNKESGKVFVGMAQGTIHEYDLSDDVNTLTLARNYLAHTKRVNGTFFSLDYNWLLSCGNDKQFQWHCTKSGRRIGGYSAAKAPCTCLQFDSHSCYAFMGDRGGEIHVFKLSENSLKPVTILKGHSGGILSLTWDEERKLLFSGSADQSIIIWDIGGQKGSAVELHGHRGCVHNVSLTSNTKKLLSYGEDRMLVMWDMTVERKETPNWSQSDMCEKCASPFFWNFKQMWDQKIVGVRQHHCRKCGRAVCQKCSDKMSVLPKYGYEHEVRLCQECFLTIKEEDKVSTTAFYELKHGASHLQIDHSRGRMLTCGSDDVVMIWDVKEFLNEHS